MTDADLIYNALLRAERQMERAIIREPSVGTAALRRVQLGVLQVIREEIGNGLAEAKQGRDAHRSPPG